MDRLTFNSVKNKIENDYPNPIASIFRRCRISAEEDIGGRHMNLIDYSITQIYKIIEDT